MATQQLYDRDGNPVFVNPPRAPIGPIEVLLLLITLVLAVVIVAEYLGISSRTFAGPPAVPTLAAPTMRPTLQPAPVVMPQPAPIIQTVPEGQAPQQVIAPAAQPAPAPAEPQAAPAPRPIVIVQHEGGSAPRITGSGACAVAEKGARRCAK